MFKIPWPKNSQSSRLQLAITPKPLVVKIQNLAVFHFPLRATYRIFSIKIWDGHVGRFGKIGWVDVDWPITRVWRFTWNFRCSMFRYLGETKPMSDSDVYCCELWYIFCGWVLCVLFYFSSEVTIKCLINIPCFFICTYSIYPYKTIK